MTLSSLPPGLILIAAGILLPFFGPLLRRGLLLAAPLLALYTVWQIPDGAHLSLGFLDLAWMFDKSANVTPGDFNLVLVQGDRLSRLFATVFTFMAFAGALYAQQQHSKLELSAAFIYAGGAVGVCFAGDFITVFIFWELMAIASTMVVWSGRTAQSQGAGMRYVLIHLLGGVLLMAGIVDYIFVAKSIAFGVGPIQQIMGLEQPGTWLILAGVLINAGAPPFSAWLADAYPESSFSGMVFLSAFTTKTAVFVLIKTFVGFDVLIYVGLYMVFYGIIYALLENDMRRILAYSIINQVGFMVTGIGMAGSSNPEFNQLAINGAAAHAFAHIIYKALLLMSAGAVLYQTGKRKCTDLGGLFQSMPLTMVCGTIGALAISAFPFTSGFISKSMISQSAANQGLMVVWLLLMAASAGVFLHAGIKFPWFVFFQKDSGLRPSDPPWSMRLAMVLMAAICIGLGIWPEPLYAILPFTVTYKPYTPYHLVEMLQLLLFSGLAFFLMLPLMKRTLTISLDFDWFYRVFGKVVFRMVAHLNTLVRGYLWRGITHGTNRLFAGLSRWNGPNSVLARTWSTGSMVMGIGILLVIYMTIYLS